MTLADLLPLDDWAQAQWDQHEQTWRELGILDDLSVLTFRPMLQNLSMMRHAWQALDEHGVFNSDGRINGIMEHLLQLTPLVGGWMADNMVVRGGKPVSQAFGQLGQTLTDAWDPDDENSADVIELRPTPAE